MSEHAKEPKPFKQQWTENAFDTIDAWFFSGDTFHCDDALARVEWYMARWRRQMESIRVLIVEPEAAQAEASEQISIDCPVCKTSGVINNDCWFCDGTGKDTLYEVTK